MNSNFNLQLEALIKEEEDEKQRIIKKAELEKQRIIKKGEREAQLRKEREEKR